MSSNKSTLKTYFEPGDRPTSLQFADLIDSTLNIIDDKASDTDAENSAIDNKFITPKTARKSVEKYAPVKKVNIKSPNINGEISLVIADIPNLESGLNSKQATLVSGTTIKTINGSSILASGNLLLATLSDITELQANFPVFYKLNTAFSQSVNISRVDVPGLKFNIVAGKKYKVEIFADYQTVATTTGGSIGFILSSGTGSIKGIAEMQTTASSSEKKLISAINTTNTTVGSFITSSQVSAINTPNFITSVLYFECITAGVFQLQWGTEVAGSAATLNAGSVIIVTPLF